MLDIFGNDIYIGDYILYADGRDGSSEIALDLYEVENFVEEIEGDGLALVAIRRNGDGVGDRYYIADTTTRVAICRNVFKDANCWHGAILN